MGERCIKFYKNGRICAPFGGWRCIYKLVTAKYKGHVQQKAFLIDTM